MMAMILHITVVIVMKMMIIIMIVLHKDGARYCQNKTDEMIRRSQDGANCKPKFQV